MLLQIETETNEKSSDLYYFYMSDKKINRKKPLKNQSMIRDFEPLFGHFRQAKTW